MAYTPSGAGPTAETILAAAREAFARGSSADAVNLCKRVLSEQPQHIDALLLMAGIALAIGQNQVAHQVLRKAVSYAPDSVPALVRLAGVLCTLHGQEEAAAICRRAIHLAPADVEARYVLGQCCLDLWRISEAIEAFQTATELNPGFALAFDRLGYALQLAGRDAESVAAYRRALSLSQNLPNSYANLAKVLRRQGEAADADAVLQEAARISSASAQQLYSLANAFRIAENSAMAEQVLLRAIQLDPAADAPRLLLGQIMQESGSFDEASTLLRGILTTHPDNSTVYHEIVYGGKITANDAPLIEAMAQLLARSAENPKAAVELNYALGKAHEDLGDFERAIEHFHEANRLKAPSQDESDRHRISYANGVNNMISTFTKEFFQTHRALGSDAAEPVFVIGMPRSGTTLTEQILSRHPQIGTVGELSYLSSFAPALVDANKQPRADRVAELREGYAAYIRLATNGEPLIIDKMPENYKFAGPIHLVYPRARIIHCRRNPIDTCLSIYTTPISVAFSHSLADLAYSYIQYQDLAAHWRSVLPTEQFLEFDYEELVSNPEPVLRRLTDFLGVAWDESVLKIGPDGRSIHTASRWQARQPIHSGSVGRWRKFEPWLGELLAEFPTEA